MSVLSVKKNDTEKLIVQGSRIKSQNQRLMSQQRLVMILIYLSPPTVVVQRNLNEFWIRILPIMLGKGVVC